MDGIVLFGVNHSSLIESSNHLKRKSTFEKLTRKQLNLAKLKSCYHHHIYHSYVKEFQFQIQFFAYFLLFVHETSLAKNKKKVFEIVQCTHQDIWLDFFILYVFIYLSTYILNTMMKKKLFSRSRFQCQDDDDDDGEVCFSE